MACDFLGLCCVVKYDFVHCRRWQYSPNSSFCDFLLAGIKLMHILFDLLRISFQFKEIRVILQKNLLDFVSKKNILLKKLELLAL